MDRYWDEAKKTRSAREVGEMSRQQTRIVFLDAATYGDIVAKTIHRQRGTARSIRSRSRRNRLNESRATAIAVTNKVVIDKAILNLA